MRGHDLVIGIVNPTICSMLITVIKRLFHTKHFKFHLIIMFSVVSKIFQRIE